MLKKVIDEISGSLPHLINNIFSFGICSLQFKTPLSSLSTNLELKKEKNYIPISIYLKKPNIQEWHPILLKIT